MLRSRILVTMVGIALATSACVASGSATMGTETTGVVYQDPPPPRVETFGSRPGFLFVKGRWNWSNGQWAWVDGHWERERSGYAWNEGRWERRGNRWEWIDGTWTTSNSAPPPPMAQGGVSVGETGPRRPVDPGYTQTTTTNTHTEGGVSVTTSSTSEYPNAAPPPLRVESQAGRAGFVWVSGRWDWKGGQWAWVDGHWERERANQIWIAGSWELRANRWVWTEGRWDVHAAPPAGGQVRDHRR